MVKIYKKTEVVQFGEMIQEFKIVSPVKVLELKYKVVNGKVKCLLYDSNKFFTKKGIIKS